MISSVSSSLASLLGAASSANNIGRPSGPHKGPPPGPPPDAAETTSDFMSDFDTDGSGTVDKAELSKVLTSKGVDNADEVADKMLSELGASDGTITKDQVSAAFDAKQKEMDDRMASMRVRMQTGGQTTATDSSASAQVFDVSNTTSSGSQATRSASSEDSVMRFAGMLAQYRSLDASAGASQTQGLLAAA